MVRDKFAETCVSHRLIDRGKCTLSYYIFKSDGDILRPRNNHTTDSSDGSDMLLPSSNMYVCKCICICMYTHALSLSLSHTHTHTHIKIYIHTHKHTRSGDSSDGSHQQHACVQYVHTHIPAAATPAMSAIDRQLPAVKPTSAACAASCTIELHQQTQV